MKTSSRDVTYAEAINLTLHDLMRSDARIVLVGQGVWSPWYVGGTCSGLLASFGKDRVIDTPVSECGTAAMACGLAIAGMRPILVFPRMDFMLYAADPIINQIAKWCYMTGGRVRVPILIWAIINRFGAQGAQHSQDLTWLFQRVAGLQIVSPLTPQEAHDLMVAGVYDGNPVMFIDDRERYGIRGPMSAEDVAWPKFIDDYDLSVAKPTMPVPASPKMEEEYYQQLTKRRAS